MVLSSRQKVAPAYDAGATKQLSKYFHYKGTIRLLHRGAYLSIAIIYISFHLLIGGHPPQSSRY